MIHTAEFPKLMRLSPGLVMPASHDETWAQEEQALLEESWAVILHLAAARTVTRVIWSIINKQKNQPIKEDYLLSTNY